MRRTVSAARRELEGMILDDLTRRQLTDEINRASARAVVAANGIADEYARDCQVLRDRVLEDLCTLRDDFAALAEEGRLGRVIAREYGRRFNALQAEQRRLTKQEDELIRMADFVDGIEEDPEAYGDGLFAKVPLTQTDYSF